MKEPAAISQQFSTVTSLDQLAAPLLYLSSTEAGWEGLSAQAFYEPLDYEPGEPPEVATPVARDVSLVLFTGGSMTMSLRHAHGPWQELHLHHEDLILSTDEDIPREVRWKISAAGPARTLHMHLNKDLLARTAEEVAGLAAPQLSLVERTALRDPLLTQIALTLWRELEQPSPAGKLYAQSAAQLLAVHLLRQYAAPGKTIEAPSQRLMQQQLRRVSDFVQEHLNQDLSLETLAEQTGFSAYYFARLFRQTTGESPHQFVLRQRIERAQRLLKERELPLAQIALESGFANQSHLTGAFKRALGLTPRAYQRHLSI